MPSAGRGWRQGNARRLRNAAHGACRTQPEGLASLRLRVGASSFFFFAAARSGHRPSAGIDLNAGHEIQVASGSQRDALAYAARERKWGSMAKCRLAIALRLFHRGRNPQHFVPP